MVPQYVQLLSPEVGDSAIAGDPRHGLTATGHLALFSATTCGCGGVSFVTGFKLFNIVFCNVLQFSGCYCFHCQSFTMNVA
jgi:hypothetical protein